VELLLDSSETLDYDMKIDAAQPFEVPAWSVVLLKISQPEK
jgi:hypothetical protein